MNAHLAKAKEFQRKIAERKNTGGVIQNPLFITRDSEGIYLTEQEARDATRAANANNFPIVPIAKDVYGDTQYKIKQDLRATNPLTGVPAISSATPVPWTDKDTSYFTSKVAAEDYAGFAAWCKNRVNLSSYAELDWAQRTMPFLFDPQEQLLEQKLNDCNKFAKIRLRGPQSEDDWEFMYMVETGVIKLPKGPIYDPFNEGLLNAGLSLQEIESGTVEEWSEAIGKENYKSYRRGLFSPLVPVVPEKGGKAANRYNLTDPTGAPRTNYAGPFGALPALSEDYAKAYGGTYRDPSLGAYREEEAAFIEPRRFRKNIRHQMEAAANIVGQRYDEPMDIDYRR